MRDAYLDDESLPRRRARSRIAATARSAGAWRRDLSPLRAGAARRAFLREVAFVVARFARSFADHVAIASAQAFQLRVSLYVVDCDAASIDLVSRDFLSVGSANHAGVSHYLAFQKINITRTIPAPSVSLR